MSTTCGGEVSFADEASESVKNWLLYRKDATLHGDYLLVSEGVGPTCLDNRLGHGKCGSFQLKTTSGLFDEHNLWRLRNAGGQDYKFEALAESDCLGVSNYVSPTGEINTDYFGAGKFKSSFSPELYKVEKTMPLWSWVGDTQAFLTVKGCERSAYRYELEDVDLKTKFNIIPSIEAP